jgi:hypothetical protein
MAEGGIKNRVKPELRVFGVPALAGGAVARSSALKFFEVFLFASAPPPEGGTPNLDPLKVRDCEDESILTILLQPSGKPDEL